LLNVLIVDDEAPAREVLLHHCHGHADVNVIGQCSTADMAMEAIATRRVDAMFLDIRMPLKTGVELLRGLRSSPLTVIVSAHKDHAMDGFDLDVVDYLLKPVSAQRFNAALEKIRRRFALQSTDTIGRSDDLIVKVGRTMQRFRLGEISCLEAHGNFVKIWTGNEFILATVTLRRLSELLPAHMFIQVHKSYIVNRTQVVEQALDLLRLEREVEIPIGKTYRGKVAMFP
jgi:two-component system, LytTR family, response regulator